jgi:hypothetical protein
MRAWRASSRIRRRSECRRCPPVVADVDTRGVSDAERHQDERRDRLALDDIGIGCPEFRSPPKMPRIWTLFAASGCGPGCRMGTQVSPRPRETLGPPRRSRPPARSEKQRRKQVGPSCGHDSNTMPGSNPTPSFTAASRKATCRPDRPSRAQSQPTGAARAGDRTDGGRRGGDRSRCGRDTRR